MNPSRQAASTGHMIMLRLGDCCLPSISHFLGFTSRCCPLLLPNAYCLTDTFGSSMRNCSQLDGEWGSPMGPPNRQLPQPRFRTLDLQASRNPVPTSMRCRCISRRIDSMTWNSAFQSRSPKPLDRPSLSGPSQLTNGPHPTHAESFLELSRTQLRLPRSRNTSHAEACSDCSTAFQL